MAKLVPLPTRLLSDLEAIRPALEDAIQWQRDIVRIRALSDAEHTVATDVLVNLLFVAKIITELRSREQDITYEAQQDTAG